MVKIIGRTEGLNERLLEIGERAAPVTQHNTFCAMLLDNLLQIIRNMVERFFPARFPPFSRTPFPIPDHRVLNSLAVILERLSRSSSGAQVTASEQMWITPDMFDRSIFYFNLDGAAYSAHCANAVHRL